VASGEAWLDPAVARGLLDEFAARPDWHRRTSADLQELTAREVEVLVLVAHGLSNVEIAEHFVIGEATVKTHVSRIMMKLGLRDRPRPSWWRTRAASCTGHRAPPRPA
jgi:DNA-binding NarL/FixJ family response regulator